MKDNIVCNSSNVILRVLILGLEKFIQNKKLLFLILILPPNFLKHLSSILTGIVPTLKRKNKESRNNVIQTKFKHTSRK